MKSRSSWLWSLLLGTIFFTSVSSVRAQNGVPSGITFQGLLLDQKGVPVNSQVSMIIHLLDTAGSLIYQQSLPAVNVTNGIFNVVLGNPFPPGMSFNEQYS